MAVKIPANYVNKLDPLATQRAIKIVKDTFEVNLANKLDLLRVSAPLFVHPKTGLNDNLSGVEQPVSFTTKDENEKLEIVHSLAKWKRMALAKYNIPFKCGLYTDMNAIRREEERGNLHSLYVDQWDWEKIISREERNFTYLKRIVKQIYTSMQITLKSLQDEFPILDLQLPKDIHFITSQELLDLYPDLPADEREHEICKRWGSVFIMQIGNKLSNGLPHDSRAPDYDDWSLNGDILIWYPLLETAVELSSMGIRVDQNSLIHQLKLSGDEDRVNLPYHQSVLNNQLPLTIGGGIGQSRMCMIFLEKAHIGEVQASVWEDGEVERLKKYNINIL